MPESRNDKRRQSWDDDTLLAHLAAALEAAEAVPRDFVAAGKAAFAWHNIDAELAELAYDSGLEPEEESFIRAEFASLRAMTYVSRRMAIELEIAAQAIQGQVIPPQTGEVRVDVMNGRDIINPIDEVGAFTIRPVPAAPFRLHCRTDEGGNVITDWIRL